MRLTGDAMTLPLSPQVFAILAGLIEEKTGIHYTDRSLFQDKVSPRAEEAGFDSLLEYYYFLRYDPAGEAELAALLEHLVVKETYLFRELDQVTSLFDSVVEPRLARGENVRIWSAACATGEEPLTLAMLAASRRGLQALGTTVELIASDISARALDTARLGLFGRRSVRTTLVPTFAAPWLKPLPDGRVAVDARLVDAVSWKQLNLRDRRAISALGTFDLVLCRNVLIYFRDDVTRQVVETLAGVLRPSGALAVGVSESLLRFGTSLVCEEQGGAFFYRKGASS